MKIAAVGDIHVGETSAGQYTKLFDDISQNADILVLCGDLTQHGKATEAHILAQDLSSCKIPVIGVLGNHDFESNEVAEINEILKQARMVMLDGTSYTYKDVGFAGIKGFGGGFDNLILSSWGEPAIKEFVKEAVNESLKLEKALSELETDKKVVIMHYSPIRATVVGEPECIFPFLGSSRHADTINRLGATVVFHGHAHHGTHEGKTSKDIPVFNVSYAIMEKLNPSSPYRLFEI